MKRRLAMLVLAAMTTPVVAQWISLPTPGIPRTADGAPDLSAHAPRAADGNPDLSGLWYPVEVAGDFLNPANAQERARLLMAEREARFLSTRLVETQLLAAELSRDCLKTVVAAPIMDDTSLRFAGTISVLPSRARLPNRSR